MDNKDIFATNLRYYMTSNGKSRKDVAEATGVSYFTFTDWVNGKKFPRMDKVERLAKYFGVKISDLIEKKTIEENPTEMAAIHAEMVKDEDFVEVYQYFKTLDSKKRQIIKDLIRNLSED